MLDNVKRFDMDAKPRKQILRPLIWLLTFPESLAHKEKIKKVNMNGIKPPFLLLGNHNAFLDFKTLTRAIFPSRCNYVIAIDGFIGREGLLRAVGGICKRKFTFDLKLIDQIKEAIRKKSIVVIYPEARYSLCGTKSIIPKSNARLAKHLGVPLVTLCCNGHHVNSPFYNTHNNKLKGLEARLECIATKEQLKELSVEEIHEKINYALRYDDYAWQKKKGIRNTYPHRAEGLEKVLYQCPHCGTEYEMSAKDNILTCNHCHKSWKMSELGELIAKEGETEFSHIPDWYEWERENVRKEVRNGTYHFESKVRVDSLPNAKRFIPLGEGYLVHDKDGFHLKGKYNDEEYEVNLAAKNHYSVHIEYNYLGKYGDCVDLNTLDDTLYVYPLCEKFSVTKMSLACEELYKFLNNKEEMDI